jgi:hypothetical protein
MIAYDSAATGDVVQEALSQHLFDGYFVGAVLAELRTLHVGVGGGDPLSGRVVQHDGIELLDVFRKEHGQLGDGDRLISAALLTQRLHGVAAVGHAVAPVRILAIEVVRRVEDEHRAGFGGLDAGFFRDCLPDLLLPVFGYLFDGRCDGGGQDGRQERSDP